MKTTASSYFIDKKNTWSGITFSVVDENKYVFFESYTRSPAVAACHYLNNKSNVVTIENNKIRLNPATYLEFNNLIVAHRMGRPLKKEKLALPIIELRDGDLDIENGHYIRDSVAIPIYKFKEISEVFEKIQKGKPDA